MVTFERDHQTPENNSSTHWTSLRFPSQGNGYIIDGGVSWDTQKMPSDLEINTFEINTLLDQLGLDYLVEIDQYEPPKPELMVNHMSGNGEATAAQAQVQEKTSVQTKYGSEKVKVSIDFHGLRRKAQFSATSLADQQRVFAEYVEHAFRRELAKLAAKDLRPELERDGLHLLTTFTALLVSSNAMELLSNYGQPTDNETMFIFIMMTFMVLLSRLTISISHVFYRMHSDEEYKTKLSEKIMRRHVEQNIDPVHAMRQEIQIEILKGTFLLQVPGTVNKMVTVARGEAQNILQTHQLFRGTQNTPATSRKP